VAAPSYAQGYGGLRPWLAKPGLELLVMFEDEGRFGRMSRPMRCWAPLGMRTDVKTQRPWQSSFHTNRRSKR